MQAIWVFLLAATGATQASDNFPQPAVSQAINYDQLAMIQPDSKVLKREIADALRLAGAAKSKDVPRAVKRLVELFDELGSSSDLTATEKQRLGVELRSRLNRYEIQFRSEIVKANRRATAGTTATAANATTAQGGQAVEGLNDLIDVIQKTIGPQDWVLAQQRPGFPNGGGGAGAGFGGQQGQPAGGGATFQQMTDANGQALADLIQDTVAPDTWDIRGGPGKVVYFGAFHALVIRQTGDVHDELGDLIGALRK